MTEQTRRSRRVRIGRERADGDLSTEDIERFLDEHAAYDPEIVEVVFEVDDPVRDPS